MKDERMADKNHDHIRRLREEANTIRKQEQAKRRRNRMLTQIGIIVGAVVVVGGIVALIVFGPQLFNPRPPFEASGQVEVPTQTGEPAQVPVATTDRGVMVGEPTAPVTVTYWYDYSCPHCVEYHEQVGFAYNDLVTTGQVKVEYVPINYVAPFGAQAGAALLAIAQHHPERFLEISDAVFAIPAQQQSSWTGAQYADLFAQYGVSDEATLKDVREGLYLRIVADSTKAAHEGGVKGTPTVAINDQKLEALPSAAELYDLVIAQGAAVENPLAIPPADPLATAPAEPVPSEEVPAETPSA